MRTAERWWVLVLCAVIGGFHVWTVRSTADPWNFGEEQRDYYNRLIDGWLDGQLHMKVEVPEALLKLKNPYDPAERPPGLGLHDASFYRGRYYLYFGAAPMVTLMLPFRLITGMDLPLPVAVLVFVYGGFLASAAVWLGVKGRYFPRTTTGATVAALTLLGLASAGPILLRRPDIWELPIAGGSCFALLMLGCVWRSLHSDGTRGRWLAGAGLFLGLAIASRPTYLIASPCLAAPLVWWWRKERRVPWRWALRATVPLAFVGALMAWHNYARFGNPLQFGQTYQFSLDYESKLPHFGVAYVPFNMRAHFFAGAEWSRYFPFIRSPDLGAAPPGFTIHRGDVYGILANFPIAWLVFLAPLALWRRTDEERGNIGAWLATVGLLFALAAAVMVSFFSALARYQGEFMPAFMLLACVGLLALERWLQIAIPHPWRGFAWAGWAAAAIFSASFGVLYSLQFDRLLREQNPTLERKIARVLNRVPAAFERLTGRAHGAIELSVRLPAERRAANETLLTVGEPPRMDRVFVRELADGQFQFGVAPSGALEQVSRPLPLEVGALHRVRIALGSLLPPITHPFFSGWTEDEIRATVRQVKIELDGEAVLVSRCRSPDPASGRVRAGGRSLGNVMYPRFRGSIVEIRRVPVAPGAAAKREVLDGAGDTLRLQVRFPAGRAGQREPLVVTGTTGAGDLLLVEYLDDRTVQLALDHWGAPIRRSRPFSIANGGPFEMRVTMKSLAVVEDAMIAGSASAGWIRVTVDGETIWNEETYFYPAEAGEIAVGRNPIGGTTSGPLFTGEILAVERVGHE